MIPSRADRHRRHGRRARRIGDRAADAAGRNVDSALRRRAADLQRSSRRRQRRRSTSACRSSSRRCCPRRSTPGLPAPYNTGTYLWGYNINSAGAQLARAHDRGHADTATTAIYTNRLVNTRLQKPDDRRADRCIGPIRWAPRQANNCVNGPPLAARAPNRTWARSRRPCIYTAPRCCHSTTAHPDSWFTPGHRCRGPGVLHQRVQLRRIGRKPRRFGFTTTRWVIVRQNVYSGLVGAYLIRDNRDTGLVNNPITLPAGTQEVELMIQDRQFDSNGQLLFPDVRQPDRLERRRPAIRKTTRSGCQSSSVMSSRSTARAGR